LGRRFFEGEPKADAPARRAGGMRVERFNRLERFWQLSGGSEGQTYGRGIFDVFRAE
jgi:hypothetical protein